MREKQFKIFSIRNAGRGSFVEVLMPCFLIKQRSSSTVVGSKEESWCMFEVDEWRGGRVSDGRCGEVGKLARILETLVKKYLLKESARVRESV